MYMCFVCTNVQVLCLYKCTYVVFVHMYMSCVCTNVHMLCLYTCTGAVFVQMYMCLYKCTRDVRARVCLVVCASVHILMCAQIHVVLPCSSPVLSNTFG